jgi:hypothetical protein
MNDGRYHDLADRIIKAVLGSLGYKERGPVQAIFQETIRAAVLAVLADVPELQEDQIRRVWRARVDLLILADTFEEAKDKVVDLLHPASYVEDAADDQPLLEWGYAKVDRGQFASYHLPHSPFLVNLTTYNKGDAL